MEIQCVIKLTGYYRTWSLASETGFLWPQMIEEDIFIMVLIRRQMRAIMTGPGQLDELQ